MLPTTIIIFRDGVGDGQMEATGNHELRQVKSCLVELYGKLKIKRLCMEFSSHIDGFYRW